MKRFSVIVALLLAVWCARAEGPDDQYVRIYNLIQEADKLNSGGLPGEALPKYLEAETALQRFQKGYPDWNTKVIGFRLSYVATKIAAVSPQAPAPAPAPSGSTGTKPAAPPSAGTSPPAKAAPSDWEAQLAALTDQVRQLQADKVVAGQFIALTDQVRQLQADKAVLDAKLKEALSVQPAAMDPREVARAEEKIKGLQKENELLKVTLDQAKGKSLPAPDTKALDETRQALTEANLKLAEQTKTAKALALENTALQAKLTSPAPSTASAADLEATRKSLQDTSLKLTEQSKLASGLALEKEALEARLKALKTDAEAATALRAENQLLKNQLATLKTAPPPGDKAQEAQRRLAEAQARIATLQSDKEVLGRDKIALENRVKQLSTQPVTPVVAPTQAKAADERRIKQLEKERDDLQKRLVAANKELYSRKSKVVAAKVADLEYQLATARARLEVYEARQVPYTAEELDLFKQPETILAQADRKGGKRSVKELPTGTVALVAEAQRHYANRQLDKAEEDYLQVLQKDKQNVPTLANLAAIELDLGHLETAESNIKKAIALAPNDSYSLFVLGRLKFRQKKYDDAIDAFSRAAKFDSQDAQIQNFLGLALSEKGLRGPAETALRKAIQLDPGYANAHNNLAVIYLTQQPPLVELARWHYQKALAAGQPHNAELEKMLDAKKPEGSAQ